MIRKPVQLVVLFAAFFAVLTGIQIYFLMNSYSLREREIFAQVKSQLDDLEDDADIFNDDLTRDDEALKRFIQLEKGVINEADLKARYRTLSEHVQPSLARYLDSLFAPLGYQVNVRKEFTSVYSHNTKKELIHEPILIYQSSSSLKDMMKLSTGTWETSSSSERTETDEREDKGSQNYGFNIKRISYFEISNLQTILFKELFVLITVSVCILIAILILFNRSYQNLLKLKRQNENLHDVVDNVCHELRTPVATLRVVSRTLEKRYPSDVVQVLGRQVDRLEQVLQPLTAQAPSAAGGLFLQENLDSYIQDFQFSNPGVSISAESYPDSNVKLARQDMETMLSNLLGNSVKYGADQIKLRFFSDEYLRIIVEDNGYGINKEDQPYIFEKFYRIQKDNIHQTKGMGLGLYIVSRLLEKYKGTISVDSTVNCGTVFQIAIPND